MSGREIGTSTSAARRGGLPFTGLHLALLALTGTLLATGGWAIRRIGKERRP